MAYTINVPVDWIYPGGFVYIIEPASRTGYEGPHSFRNWIKGFSTKGFYYQNDNNMPVYHANFSEIGKTVFMTKDDADRALKEMSNG